MVKKTILFLALFSGIQTWCMEQQPAQPQKQVPTLSSMCSKVLLKDNKALLSFSPLEKRNFIHQFFSHYGPDVRACNLGAAQFVNYCGGYRFLTPGVVRDIVLNKECSLTQRIPFAFDQNIVDINGTIAEHHGGYITLHLWDEHGAQSRTCEIPGQQLIDSYANSCFITSTEDPFEGDEEHTLWYMNPDTTTEKVGILIHWYECIECSKVFFLLNDGTLRILDKKSCKLEIIQLKTDALWPVNFIHYGKEIHVLKNDEQGRKSVLTVFNSDTYAVEAEYPCDFEHGYCNKIAPDGIVQCKCKDTTVQVYDLKHKKLLTSFKASCQYEYLFAQQKPYVVIVPRSEGELLQLWDVTERQCIQTFDAEWRYINVCHGNIIFEKSNQVVAWNVAKQEVVLTLSEHGHDQENPVRIYDRYLIVSDAQHLKIWDMEALTFVHTMARGISDIYTHNHIVTVTHDYGNLSASRFIYLNQSSMK